MKTPTNEQITQRAHQLWIERGSQHGHHEQDWLDAEKDLTQEMSNAASAVEKKEEPIKPPSVPPAIPPVPGKRDVLN
jgi:hypothetical protein